MNKDRAYYVRWAYELSSREDFTIKEGLWFPAYYDGLRVRSAIFDVIYNEEDAILKLYDDPRPTFEVTALKQFNQHNKSKILVAPKFFKGKGLSSRKGWLLMEKIPEGHYPFSQPVAKDERERLIDLFFEYRRNCPDSANRPLSLVEQLSASEFHCFRINRWLALANEEENKRLQTGKSMVLEPEEFIPRFKIALSYIKKRFFECEMLWSDKGLFQPSDIFSAPEKDICYLNDFCRSAMYPEGYEMSSLIWSDWMISANYHMSDKDWQKGLDEWIELFCEKVKKTEVFLPEFKDGLDRFRTLMKACLIERALGSTLADITANTKMPDEEKRARLKNMYRLIDEIAS